MRIPIWISNRHIHLSPEDADKLFGKGYVFQKLKDITQPGQYACKETVTLVWPQWSIPNVRVVGPERKQTQIEILLWDNFVMGTQAPIKESGKIEGGESIKVVWPAGEKLCSGAMIVAQRHLHCTVKEAQDLGISNGQEIKIQIEWIRGLIFEHVVVRARDDYALDFHIDIEEANAAGLKNGDRGELVK